MRENPEFLKRNGNKLNLDRIHTFIANNEYNGRMDDPEQFLARDAFARQAGITLLESSSGRARVKMEVCDMHLNSHGTVHGGAIFTLADTAFAVASNSHGIPAAAINAHISYMRSVSSGTLYADAEEFDLNPKLATYTVRISDEKGVPIAIFQGMVYRKTPRK
ncbi:MAG TPA: PaaI family thioesterase [Methanoregulaceae archaeon]|nr:PaaI family thioesterase [Methanoregulaceae archaeon]HPD10881.1 PaaI family thioesterase [Methanoregulaceae archaeon]HRT16026.1 PaaI family thioesterase [Methanoregulaceae archaeon]HRU31532.1 PaaI family thioesterase [Methanoregulaceae archaeon]